VNRRARRAADRADRTGPSDAIVTAARARLAAQAAAHARGDRVEVDPVDVAAIRADARARGIDTGDPATAARLRADLVDRIVEALDR
jgi:uncharacterized protein (DUF169 family)